MKNAIAVCSANIPIEAENTLSELFEVILLPPDPTLAAPVASHADMLLTVFDKTVFCHFDYYNIAKKQIDRIITKTNYDLCLSKCFRSAEYPFDVIFNALCTEKGLIAKKSSLAPELQKYSIIDTKQGYAACTSLYVNKTVISADAAILKSADAAGICTKRISSGGIELPGYSTGFIGGACGVFQNKIYICGNPLLSDAGRELAQYCRETDTELYSLCNTELTDIGGIKII